MFTNTQEIKSFTQNANFFPCRKQNEQCYNVFEQSDDYLNCNIKSVS